MEIEYDLTKEDLYIYQWRALQRPEVRRAMRKGYLVVAGVILLPFIISPWSFLHLINWIIMALTLTIVLSIQWAFNNPLAKRSLRRLVEEEQPNRGGRGRHKIVLNERGLIESTNVNESFISWTGVDRVEQDDDYIFIRTPPHHVYAIPKRAFVSREMAEAFYTVAKINKEATM